MNFTCSITAVSLQPVLFLVTQKLQILSPVVIWLAENSNEIYESKINIYYELIIIIINY